MYKNKRVLVKKLQAAGFETRTTSKQHLLVFRQGKIVTCFAGTPRDHRSWKNSMATLRRLGFTA
ncbi:hypothetical protein QE394_001036 [Arthrobacter sp. SORGH_AS 212]|uniref:hypothetical protein n=1 Tax=Pseudarthrobacter sp. SORGH_AS 212 TaxID=3041777 RepID=UPI0027814A35|nr:hypothetical protein [Arthrobacter sp. SORGH_AS_0212]